MPLPDGVPRVTVTTGEPLVGPGGTPVKGKLLFVAPSLVVVPSLGLTIDGAESMDLTTGLGSIDLVPSDLAGMSPNGWTYEVRTAFTNAPNWVKYIRLSQSDTTVKLSDRLIPDPALGNYVLVTGPAGPAGPAGATGPQGPGPSGSAGGALSGSYPDPVLSAGTVALFDAAGAAAAAEAAAIAAIPPAASSVTTETAYGQTAAAGTATVYARGDHTHGTPALPTGSTSAAGVVQIDGTAVDIQPLGTPAAGAVGKVADAGHVHAMPRLDQVGAPTADVSLDNHKITGLLAGAAATDAVTVAQIPNPATVIQVGAPTGVVATDQASINAALAALPAGGGAVQLQAGTYAYPAPGSPSSGCINMSVNGSVLRGMGMGVTTIQLAPGSAGVTGIIRTPSGVANSMISFQDLTIDGNAAAQTGAPTVIGFFCGVTPNGTASDTDISCIRVEIKNCTGYGFDPHERTTRLLLRDCISHNNGTDGLHDGFTLDACYDSVVEGCTAYSNGRHGFNLVTASNGVTLIGCKSYSNSGNGYTLQNGAKNNVLDGCTAYSNTLDGIYINGVPQTGQQDNTPGVNNALKGCTIRLSGAHGIHLVGASHNHLSGNTVRDSSQTATNTSHQIYFDESGTVYSTYNTVVDNDLGITAGVTNAPKYGIREKSTNEDNNFIFGNRSQGAVTAQISLLGPTSARLAAHNGVNEHPATAPYIQDVPSLHGLAEWNFQPSAAGATSTVTAGKVYLSRLTVQNGGALSNLVINITTAGAGLTASYVAIFDNTGAQLAVSSDISASLAGTGGVALAFPSTTFAPGAVILAALLVGNGSTTPPTLARGASGSGARNYGLTTAGPLAVATYSSGLTAMPASITLASTTATGAVDFWFGLS